MTEATVTPNSDEITQKQIDHLDEMLHECLEILRELRPLIPLAAHSDRLMVLLDPGTSLRKAWKGTNGRRAGSD